MTEIHQNYLIKNEGLNYIISSWISSSRLCWSGARGWHQLHFPCESWFRELEKKAENSHSPWDECRSEEKLALHLAHNSNRQQIPKHESILEWILQLIQIGFFFSYKSARYGGWLTRAERVEGFQVALNAREARGVGAFVLPCTVLWLSGFGGLPSFFSSSRFQGSVRSSCSRSNEPHPLMLPLL